MTLPDDWQTNGRAIPIEGCGNPWHYTNLAEARQQDGSALRTALVETLGSLHNIEYRAGMIVRWINDPNLHPVDEAKAIQRLRSEAHERIVAALAALPPSAHGDDLLADGTCRICGPSAPPALEVDLIQRVMFRLVGTSGVPDLDSGGTAFLAHREFAEMFASEYARLQEQDR